MKIAKAFCFLIILLLVLLSVGTFIGFYLLIPRYIGIRTVSRESGNATITRELNGIPHIEADSEQMAFYSLGYIHAQDRLWQMDRSRRVSQGSLSELFGEVTIQADKTLRNFAFRKWAEETYPTLSAKMQEKLTEYAAGVNEFVDHNYLPIEYYIIGVRFDEWTPIDTLTTCMLMQLHLTFNWPDEIYYSLIGDDELADKIFPFKEEHLYSGDKEKYGESITTIMDDDDLKQSGLYSQDHRVKNSDDTYKSKHYEFTHERR